MLRENTSFLFPRFFLSLFLSLFFKEYLPLVAAKAKHHGLKYPQGCHGVSRVRNVYELLPACIKTPRTIRVESRFEFIIKTMNLSFYVWENFIFLLFNSLIAKMLNQIVYA